MANLNLNLTKPPTPGSRLCCPITSEGERWCIWGQTQLSLTTLSGHSHTGFKSLRLPLQLVRTEEASWMRSETSSSKLKKHDTALRVTVTRNDRDKDCDKNRITEEMSGSIWWRIRAMKRCDVTAGGFQPLRNHSSLFWGAKRALEKQNWIVQSVSFHTEYYLNILVTSPVFAPTATSVTKQA